MPMVIYRSIAFFLVRMMFVLRLLIFPTSLFCASLLLVKIVSLYVNHYIHVNPVVILLLQRQ